MRRPHVIICHDGTELEFATPHAFLDWYAQDCNPQKIRHAISPTACDDLDNPPAWLYEDSA